MDCGFFCFLTFNKLFLVKWLLIVMFFKIHSLWSQPFFYFFITSFLYRIGIIIVVLEGGHDNTNQSRSTI